MKFSICLLIASACTSNAFTTVKSPLTRVRVFSSEDSSNEAETKQVNKVGNLFNGFETGFNILKKGMSSGDSFKQSLADAFAGPELDLQAAQDRIDAYITKSPVVVFSWTVSSFSTKAKNLLKSIGATYEAVELGAYIKTRRYTTRYRSNTAAFL